MTEALREGATWGVRPPDVPADEIRLSLELGTRVRCQRSVQAHPHLTLVS